MLSDKLSEEIADLILSGVIELGARLEEQALADRFGVSRTPVREALRRLAGSGLVELRARRPAIVRRLNADQLADLFETLGDIEALCARYAADRMTQAERLRLSGQLGKAAEALENDDSAAYRSHDAELHRLIHRGTHNASLGALAEQVRGQTAVYSSAPYTMPNHTPDLRIPHRQHEAVVQAILDRDAAAAQRVMADHIGASFLTIQSILARSEAGEGPSAAAAE